MTANALILCEAKAPGLQATPALPVLPIGQLRYPEKQSYQISGAPVIFDKGFPKTEFSRRQTLWNTCGLPEGAREGVIICKNQPYTRRGRNSTRSAQ